MPTEDNKPIDESIRRLIDRWVTSGEIASKDYQSTMTSTNSVAGQWVQSHRDKDSSTSPGSTLVIGLPRLVIADVQTQGRGRLGRTWDAQSDGLAFSIVMKGCHELLSIAVGVAIAEAIEHVAAPVRCGLKWPNDVWMSGVKVAGTLIERFDSSVADRDHSTPVAVIGIGINVGSSPTLEDAEATSVQEATGKWVTRAALLEELVPALIEQVTRCESDSSGVLDAFRRRCVLTGEMIRCSIDGQSVEGRCEGINEHGEMRVRTIAGESVCRSGEVNRVRRV
ncbi:BirA family biotin operon repressor/biotin-[acetyl-CoA-carboxylase] ligase [Rhodopirellula rubra]|uniref:BirA family biotin operon repressor/biotin-[acetyl-CoA-carboxylase] ligase n=1 Tax=Aporhodopirellula rubra TaxID=980271 RepID=A0A7W5DX33_9BACT|nr:biotin--[acetyl-CoA-carboxylase] ligase [Aporhodopirellula rubra]MBB3205217.1 BirA family biotin operon repressor/biotin-[acetyl-CoA-carboxylase] ligase [Aporhodopirellula rubra]